MEISIQGTPKDEYVVEGTHSTVGSFPTIDKAIAAAMRLDLDYIRREKVRIRHRLTAYTDNDVVCSELLKGKGKKRRKSGFHG